MADKKIMYSEPAGYFPKHILKEIEKSAAGSKKKPAAKKKKTVKRK